MAEDVEEPEKLTPGGDVEDEEEELQDDEDDDE